MKKNQNGFSVIEVLITIVVIGVLGLVGWYVWHVQQKHPGKTTSPQTTKTTSSSSNQYSGWNNYVSSNSLGLSFKYPASWTTAEDTDNTCAGEKTVSIRPTPDEVAATYKAIGADYIPIQPQNNGGTVGSYYTIKITRAGAYKPTECGTSNGSTGVYNWNGISEKYLQSTDQISSGSLQQRWVTFYGPSDDSSKTSPDSIVVTTNRYEGSSHTFTDSGIITVNNIQYQVNLEFIDSHGQYASSPALNIDAVVATQVYKDSLKILNSLK